MLKNRNLNVEIMGTPPKMPNRACRIRFAGMKDAWEEAAGRVGGDEKAVGTGGQEERAGEGCGIVKT